MARNVFFFFSFFSIYWIWLALVRAQGWAECVSARERVDDSSHCRYCPFFTGSNKTTSQSTCFPSQSSYQRTSHNPPVRWGEKSVYPAYNLMRQHRSHSQISMSLTFRILSIEIHPSAGTHSNQQQRERNNGISFLFFKKKKGKTNLSFLHGTLLQNLLNHLFLLVSAKLIFQDRIRCSI